MKRQFKKLIIVVASLATVASSVTPAAACGGGGGGYGGYARASVYRASSYTPYPTYQSRYSQPQVCNQTRYGFNQSASVINRQPVQQIARTPQAGVPTQASFQQSAVQQPARQTTVRAQAPATAPTNQLASVAKSAAAQTPAAKPAASAESSALQMLQSLGTQPAKTTATASSATIPQFSAAPKSTDQAHVGTWKVSLPNNQSVELLLQADGKFVWTAVSKGNRKTFDGQYRLSNDRLTLVRSNDLQQMGGNWTGSENQFTFKLDGANNGGLSFKRS